MRRAAPCAIGLFSVGELGVGDVAQVAERRDAVAGEHVVRIGQVARDRLGGIALRHVIAQRSSASLNATSGTGEVALARPREEVGHVGVEPHVVAARAPQAERAVRALARQHALDRVADALVDRGVERELRLARELVDVEQRQRAAGGLLGAAERIAVERLQQRRDVERGRGTDRELHAAGARHEIGEQVARDRDALAFRRSAARCGASSICVAGLAASV